MTRFAICTAIYEKGRPFLSNWIDAAAAAAAGHDVQAIIAVDDFDSYPEALAPLREIMPVTVTEAEHKGNPGLVRRTMLEAGLASSADVLVFCDMDDLLLGDALASHEAVLQKTDFSYGDLALIAHDGKPLNRSFFAGAGIPPITDRAEQICDRNWLGFSNTAVRRDRVPADAVKVPESVIAVDWWFFTYLVRAGLKGGIARKSVASYRIHDSNEIGPLAACSRAALLRRCEIMARHFECFLDDQIVALRASAVARLARRLRDGSEIDSLEATSGIEQAGVWYEDVSRLIVAGGSTEGVSSRVQFPTYFVPSLIATRSSLVRDLSGLGVAEGDTLMVHAAVNSIGHLIGGATSLIDALEDAVGTTGTIMMPAFTGDLTDPSTWFKPPVPEEWWPRIRDEMPAFDPPHTPCNGVGLLPEIFRTREGTLRSCHPVSSFTVRGRNARTLTAGHPLDQRFGPDSPLGKLCTLGGRVLLIGAPFESVSLLHMTSYITEPDVSFVQRAPMLIGGRKIWVEFKDRVFSWRWFPAAVQHLIDTGVARSGMVGSARAVLLPAAESVDAVVRWRRQTDN